MQTLGFYQFDDFLIDPVRRQVCRAGVPVSVPQKAFQLLLFLLENPGRVLTKREIMDAVWPQAFVEETNLTQSIFLLRKALGELPGQNRYIVTVPGAGYQFAVLPVEVEQVPAPQTIPEGEPRLNGDENSGVPVGDANPLAPAIEPSVHVKVYPVSADMGHTGHSALRRWVLLGVPTLVLVCIASVWVWRARSKTGAKVEGTIVLAEFTNTTGDPAFDTALRQGLAAQLDQSPNLGLLSDSRIAQAMKLMAQPVDARLTSELARQVCQRTASDAVIDGSITRLGSQYVLGLRALQCKTGDLLAQDQETADSKEHVLHALGIAAGNLRRRLGESLESLEKYDAPPEGVTTGSLEALEAYGLGRQAQDRGDGPAAIAYFKQAISHDPEFAMAYGRLGVCDSSQEGVLATRKAYELRGRVSDRERLYLESHYEQYATGNLPAARKILETWAETYPHDGDPVANLLKLYLTTGEYERAFTMVQSLVKNSPATPVVNTSRLATTLLFLNRVEESKAVLLDAVARHNDSPVHHYYLYEIDFLQKDSAAMASEASYLRAQPGWSGNMLELESLSASSFGKFALARSLNEQSVQDFLREQDSEDAAGSLAEIALEEALAGNVQVARKKAKASLDLSRSSEVETLAGMAQALSGDRTAAAITSADINRRFPEDTLAQVAVSIIRACALLGDGKSPDGARRALEALAPTSPYSMSGNLSLVPVYVLGQAYLASGQSENASSAFQNILDHYGVTRNYITGPVARLGLARAEEQAGERAKARADYAVFLRLWRDADARLPMLRAAQTSANRIGP
ncbi:winged helix-turn-helix domain-containing protein [Granulicella aggregans]|uniref:winged helix-turn-helix domain-containing protein n=1 Tax=Granulicella aggregans TaxID=474949 RepID=UPI0021E0C005|nr:winged helix-turn-helix domain-containing protein [Granulicella aggregans]